MNTQQYGADPIAIVGMGCRFPGGAHDPEAFWDLLCEGRDGIVEVPKARWDIRRFYDPNPEQPGKAYVKRGGFLQQPIDQMDALFFGVTPREAEVLDPQQRLLLEVAWEALEDAGIPPDGLAGTATGVFMGGFIADHFLSQSHYFNRRQIGTHTAVSFTHTILSARLAYALDLRGPCLTLDTACSSSLVALHLACESLRAGDSQLALAGGVNLMHRPEVPVVMCKAKLLAADGRSKSFDARGDGYGRGEGAGVLVLKRLADAERDGDLIYAVVRATGVNQDGRTEGITVPNPQAQAALIRQVSAKAGIDPREIDYFEAHGTGTGVGDPLECQALGEALGQGRATPCWVGSAKANIGHLEAAAGVAGVIKTALVLRHGLIPPVANLQTPNPRIPFADLGLRLPRQVEPLPSGDQPSLAGVNSFGYGGTNAHAILQAPPQVASDPRPQRAQRPHLLLLSARSEAGLRAVSRRYAEFLAHVPESALHDVCYSAALRRAHHPWRLAVRADSGEVLLNHLRDHAGGGGAFLVQGRTATAPAAPVFVFTGMGPQWWGMGRDLLASEPVFRQVAEACDAIFRRLAGWSILEEMQRPEGESRMAQTAIAQSANFVVQAGLAALWRSWGVTPAAIVGHSVGEVAAAYVSGVLSLEDAVKVSYHRGRLQQSMAGHGRMLAVGLAEAEASELIARHGADKVSFGAINSPASLTLSGDAATLEAIAAELEARDVFNRFLRVELAYHSPVMDPLREEMKQVLADLQPGLPTLPLYSTVTGARVETVLYDADYWFANIRQPVYFTHAISKLLAAGQRLFLEVGPHPVLGTAIRETLAAQGVEGHTLHSLKRGEPEQQSLIASLGELHVRNGAIDWSVYYGDSGRVLRLPTYPWQRETYWKESEAALRDRLGGAAHPLLGLKADAPGRVWEQMVNRQFLPWLEHHKIEANVVLPGAAYVELGLALAAQARGDGPCLLEKLKFASALVVDPGDEPLLRASLDEAGDFAIHSRAGDGGAWTLHAGGHIATAGLSAPAAIDLEALRRRCAFSADIPGIYRSLAGRGLNYDSGFQTQRALHIGEAGSDEVLVELGLDGDLLGEAPEYRLHPTLLDGAFQALITLLGDDNPRSYVPVAIARLHWLQAPDPLAPLWCHARLTGRERDSIDADLILCDGAGQVLVALVGLRCQALGSAAVKQDWNDWLHWPRWQGAQPLAEQTVAEGEGDRWLVLADAAGEPLLHELRLRGARDLVVARHGERYSSAELAYTLRAGERGDVEQCLRDVASSDRVVLAWGLEPAPEDDPCGMTDLDDALHVLQVLAKLPVSPRVYLVTRRGQACLPGESPDPARAARIGLARVAAAEHPELRCTLVDTDGDWAALVDELLGNGRDGAMEPEVALRPGQRLLYRLDRASPRDIELDYQASRAQVAELGDLALAFTADGPVLCLERPAPVAGGQADLHLEQLALAAPGGFHVAIGRDGDGRQHLVVLPPGPAVRSRQALAEALFSLPLATSVSPAALLPTALARLALDRVGHLAAGQRVLIHAADAGVDIAAINQARSRGAVVYATWRHPEQQARLAALGVAASWPADSLDFVAGVRAVTNGQGVDLVLNSLGPEYARHGLELLTLDGHYIELNPDNPGLALGGDSLRRYSRVSLASLLAAQPQAFRELLGQVATDLAGGAITAPEPRQVAAGQLSEAWAAVQAGEGVVLGHDHREGLTARPWRLEGKAIRGDASYLVSGGFGGFGLVLARWLAGQGARHLVLMGRRGAADADAQAAVAELYAAGVTVLAAAVDVADAGQMEALFAEIKRDLPPLRGIFHTAGVLDDARLGDQDATRMRRVMTAKAVGAWHLHRLSLGMDLDAFVLFSSVSALIGNPGQGNYVAANAFLDALAWQRRARGLAGLSLNWGVLGDVGMAARQQEVERYLAAMGISAIKPEGAMRALDFALRQGVPQLGIMAVDWSRWAQANPDAAATPRFSLLASLGSDDNAAAGFQARLRGLPPEAREAAAIEALRGVVARVMRLPPEVLDSAIPLTGLGLDSLMASELQVAIQSGTGTRLSVLELMKGNSIATLAQRLLAGEAAAPAVAPAATAQAAPEAETATEDEEVGEL